MIVGIHYILKDDDDIVLYAYRTNLANEYNITVSIIGT